MTESRLRKPRPPLAGSDEWVVGRRTSPFYVTQPKPYRPDMLFLMDPGLDLIVACEVIQPETPVEEAARWVETALEKQREIAVKLALPRRIRVDDDRFTAALRDVLGSRIEIVEAAVPEVDAALGLLRERSSKRGGPAQGLPEEARDAEKSVARFFEAAAELYRLAPWEEADDSQTLGLDVPELGRQGACVCVIGALGESLGLLVFRSFDDYVAFLRRGEREQRGEEAGPPGVPLFSVNFDKPGDAPQDLVRRARAKGWETAAENAFPHILHVDADGMCAPLIAEDFRYATACLVGFARLLRKRRHLFSRPLARSVHEEFVLKGLPGQATVRLTAPHPEAQWRWGEETAIGYMRRIEARALQEAFLADAGSRGRSGDWLEGAEWIVEQLLDFKLDYADEGPLDWTADLVETFLLEHFPRKGNAADAQIEAMPDYLAAFFGWLRDTGREEAARVGRVLERIAHRRPAFLREARNPARFGPAKTIVLAMEREGVDPTDRKAVGRFMEDYNRRLAADPSLLPLPFEDEAGDAPPPSRPRAKAWIWTPGTPVPDPQGPCPCGSGRRYKKCCMPR